MSTQDDNVRALIAQQAGEWYVLNRAGELPAGDRKSFEDWLLASPVHVEEYLAVARIAQALPTGADDPDFPIDKILDQPADEPQVLISPSRTGIAATPRVHDRTRSANRWRLVAAAACAAIIGAVLLWNAAIAKPQRFTTGHGNQQTLRLADNSVLHLNTDSAVTVRYSGAERVVAIDRGQAFFLVAHEQSRRFRVLAGKTNVVAVGTQFDVYRQADTTIVTVVDGRVFVQADRTGAMKLPVNAGEQARIVDGVLPAASTHIDAQSSTAWLRRQIVFDHERLADIATEFNRYGTVPIEIVSPSLQGMQLTGAFSADDTDSFIAFLRSLRGVTVETGPTRIRIYAH